MTKSLFSERGWNAFYTLSLTSLHNEMQGSVVPRQVKAVPLFAFIKASDPAYYAESQALFSISRRSSLFLCASLSGKKWLRTPPFTFSFWGAFSLHKTAVSALCVCWENDKVPGGLTRAGIGGSRGLRISPLCPWKDLKSQLFEPSRAVVVGFSRQCRVRQGESQECEEDRFGNPAFLNKLQHFAECKFACSEQSPNFLVWINSNFINMHKFLLLISTYFAIGGLLESVCVFHPFNASECVWKSLSRVRLSATP